MWRVYVVAQVNIVIKCLLFNKSTLKGIKLWIIHSVGAKIQHTSTCKILPNKEFELYISKDQGNMLLYNVLMVEFIRSVNPVLAYRSNCSRSQLKMNHRWWLSHVRNSIYLLFFSLFNNTRICFIMFLCCNSYQLQF